MRPGHNEAHLEEQHVAQQELEDEEERRALGVRTCATAQWCSGQEDSPNRAATARGAEHGLGRHQHRVHARCAAIGMPITQRSNALEPKWLLQSLLKVNQRCTQVNRKLIKVGFGS